MRGWARTDLVAVLTMLIGLSAVVFQLGGAVAVAQLLWDIDTACVRMV